MVSKKYDILIVGGGHAGCEAAFVASQFSSLKIGLITLKGIGLASAPCNPSIGGVGKGQVVRELDALGGLMPRLADLAGIQFRTLNESKGFAVQSTRVQIDKEKYPHYAEKILNNISNLDIVYSKIAKVSKENSTFFLQSAEGECFAAPKVIFTVGTFLDGKLHTGTEVSGGGRKGFESSDRMEGLFSKVKTVPRRFKTGTPPRIHKDSIEFSSLEEQPSDGLVDNFHFENTKGRNLAQVSCFLTRTNEHTIKEISENLHLSPMYSGQINAVGARYCPSIEDKVFRYPNKYSHHIFLEPEGHDLDTFYPSGISSSLPKNVQKSFVRTINGLENAEIEVYGYAVEYDVVDTTLLSRSLEHLEVKGLYFAGQVNGTSGYEEAAGQGFIAGSNAALSVLDKPSLQLSRNDSYIGVMIEDLVTNTRDEPYRLFTARSENRLYIREDNAVLRMNSYRKQLELDEGVDKYNENFQKDFNLYFELLKKTYVEPDYSLLKMFHVELSRRVSLLEVLRQAKLNPVEFLDAFMKSKNLTLSRRLLKCLAISAKYDGYIEKSKTQIDRMIKLDHMKLDWQKLMESENISFECKRRIEEIRPQSFSELKNIQGIRPATLVVVASGRIC